MKGAGVCSLNREVHYIVWSLNRVSGVPKYELPKMSGFDMHSRVKLNYMYF